MPRNEIRRSRQTKIRNRALHLTKIEGRKGNFEARNLLRRKLDFRAAQRGAERLTIVVEVKSVAGVTSSRIPESLSVS